MGGLWSGGKAKAVTLVRLVQRLLFLVLSFGLGAMSLHALNSNLCRHFLKTKYVEEQSKDGILADVVRKNLALFRKLAL